MNKDIQPIYSEGYLPEKSQNQRKNEYEIRQSLLAQGHSTELANSILGYTPQQIPFIYKTEPHEVTQGNSDRPMTSELWIGTTDAIHNLAGEWNDQIPEVICQWWGKTRLDEKETPKSVERLEIHHLSDGSFVELRYRGVNEMGQFDGELAQASLNVPSGTFKPWGGPRERRSYGIYGFSRNMADLNMIDVPGGALLRKDEIPHEWTIKLPSEDRTNISGTTILNGLEQMITFHMGEIAPMKQDWNAAFRYTPLPEPNPKALLVSNVEEEFEILLTESSGETSALVESQFSRVQQMMNLLAPRVKDLLTSGVYQRQTTDMAIDGILNHPEKIQLLDKKLSDFDRESRFMLAQLVTKAIKESKFSEWLASLKGSKMERLIEDTATRNSYHLLNWWMRMAPPDADLDKWLENAEKDIVAQSEDEKINSNDEFTRCFDGMCTSFVERFVEYLAQQYLGNSLE